MDEDCALLLDCTFDVIRSSSHVQCAPVASCAHLPPLSHLCLCFQHHSQSEEASAAAPTSVASAPTARGLVPPSSAVGSKKRKQNNPVSAASQVHTSAPHAIIAQPTAIPPQPQAQCSQHFCTMRRAHQHDCTMRVWPTCTRQSMCVRRPTSQMSASQRVTVRCGLQVPPTRFALICDDTLTSLCALIECSQNAPRSPQCTLRNPADHHRRSVYLQRSLL